MTDEPFTTMRVYKRDKETLLEMYDGKAHQAFHRAVTSICKHPEDKRSYVMAELPLPGQEAITNDSERQSVGGFFCHVCRMYVFRDTRVVDTVEKKTARRDRSQA